MDAHHSKLTVVGAGIVGTSIAYAALIRGSAREVALYDVQTAKVEAEVLDLAHGTQFTGTARVSGGSDIAVTEDSDVVVVTAGAKQRPGEPRLDLAGRNSRIMAALLPDLLLRSPDAVVVLVTNPCDVLTVLAKELTGLPSSRIFASGTVLDSSRLRWLLAERFRVSQASVHAVIVGEHGDSELPLWSRATVGAMPIAQVSDASGGRLSVWDLDHLAEQVRTAAYRVIEGKGATNLAIGLAAARIAEAVLHDEHAVLPVSSVLSGEYGIDGVALSVPCVIGAAGVERVLEVPMSADELRRLRASASVIAESAAAVRSPVLG